MNVLPVNVNSQKSPNFGHLNPWEDSTYNMKERVIAGTTTALGVVGAAALLAKHSGYSLKPSKMFKNIIENIKNPSQIFNSISKDWKNSYLNRVVYDDEPVIAMGAGSCLGGLVGGYMIDKNKENRKAKQREAILQMFNISVPILFVTRCARLGKYIGSKYFEKKDALKPTYRTNVPKAVFAIGGIFAGVYTANIIANKINEKIFHRGKGRDVQASDFSAHLDDFCIAAQQIHENDVVHGISRLVPVALMVAGNEVGNKKA